MLLCHHRETCQKPYACYACVLKGVHSVGLMWWMLAREVLRLRGTISREVPWEVMPDLFFYRDPEEVIVWLIVVHDD